MPKTKGVVFLIVWFIWASGKDLETLVRFSVSTDFYIFSSVGLGYLFFIIAITVFLANTASVYCLFRPQPFGLPVIFNALIAGAIQNILTFSFAVSNLVGVREAYATGREARGLPVREGAMDMLFTPNALIISLAIMIGFYLLVAYVTYRNGSYFRGPDAGSA
ncbi:hypothetical protein QQM79_15010 [Marinobacteraceae bacterium S3BR75-40.1]